MKKNKKFLTGLLATTIISAAAITITTVAMNAYNPQTSAEKRIANYEFYVGQDFAKQIQNHFPSEYAFASYNDFRATRSADDNVLFQPELKNSSNYANQFWPYQLEISYDNEKSNVDEFKRRQEQKLFYLRNSKSSAPIDVLKATHNIYYHSYANDFTGELFLSVLLEDKNPSSKSEQELLNKSTSDTIRIDSWKSKVFKIGGFKKIKQESTNPITYNTQDLLTSKTTLNSTLTPSFKISETNTLNDIFRDKKYTLNGKDIAVNAVHDLIDNNILASEPNFDKEQISKNEILTKNLFSIENINSYNNSFKINWNKPVWFSKNKNNVNEININYYVTRKIPAAKIGNLNSLARSQSVEIEQQFSQKIYLNYFNLEKIAKQFVQIIGKKGVPLNQYTQSGQNALNFHRSSSALEPNSNNGYFTELNLKFSDDASISRITNNETFSEYESNIANYTLSYQLNNFRKPKNDKNVQNTPFVGEQQNTAITFSFELKLNNTDQEYGINTYYGTFVLDGFKDINTATTTSS
ncbi:hypothetical protein EG856_01295 [Mycoplasmopsis phocirhinis]|uniref:Uncharacterized protein n=1 Tax=Mycoplasmopsis phocirhinis TaxID=142650 RepID=A0A4P6MNX4_9BACT|nr:hypothetical protein [Mycoplasmopsis phocirhinis]QBF34560.1 hypothetical protein EG856_01295 [Mycoplasmopsis phocirhinis]